MIRSFRDRDTERVFRRLPVRRFAVDLQRAAYRKLLVLDAAMALEDLRATPGNRLEKLGGNRKGQHSIRINSQWRICFRWEGGAHHVEITDYH